MAGMVNYFEGRQRLLYSKKSGRNGTVSVPTNAATSS
jgi:hypothetical protein